MTTKKKVISAMDAEKTDIWDGVDTAEPEHVDPKKAFDYTPLTFGQRLAMLRMDKGYIQKMSKEGLEYSAVLYEDLVEQVRPLFIKYGLSWHTHSCHVVGEHHAVTEFASLLVTSTMMIFTIRFQSVEVDHDMAPHQHRDVVAPATAFDAFDPDSADPRGDTGAASAITTAQKYALRQILNIAAGDDPDFTPMISLSTRSQEERKTGKGRSPDILRRSAHLTSQPKSTKCAGSTSDTAPAGLRAALGTPATT